MNTDLKRPGAYPYFSNWPLSKKLFMDPPVDFRPAVYWFWGNEVDTDTFPQKLQEMKDKGINAFWIQPRLGYPMEKYLSEEYFNQYRAALKIARELEMYVGVYDEYNWITGHCGGKTVAGDDQFREHQLFWVEVPLDNGTPTCEPQISGIGNMLTEGHKEAMPWIYEGGKYQWDKWQVVSAFTYCRKEQVSNVKQVTDQVGIARESTDGCHLQVNNSLDENASHLLVFVSARCISSRMIDYLNPEAVNKFIRVGYEPYYQELKEDWDLIWAIFFDEPYTGLYKWDQMTGEVGTSLMFNPDFYQEFTEARGYDIRDYLYSLVWDVGQNGAKWRSDFFETYAQRIQRVFFAPLANWSHQHGVKFVGHELMTQLNHHWAFTSDSGFDVVANFGADYFGMGEYKDVSTTDSGSFNHNISPKLASSIAHVLKKNGSMLEQYTPGYPTDKPAPAARGNWNMSIEMLKQQMDFNAAQGLTQFLWHGYFQSNDVVEDNKALYSQRFDFPPGINYEPWFEYFKHISDHNGRMSYFLSQGTHVAPLAVLYPLRTYWSKGRGDVFSQESGFLNENLARLHYDYDFVDERQILSATVTDKKLWIADEGYQAVVLPAVFAVADIAVIEKLEEFVKQGGALLFTGRLPENTQAQGYSAELACRLAKLIKHPRVYYQEQPLSSLDDGVAVLADILKTLAIVSVSISEEGREDLGTFYCLRQDEDNTYLALVNDEKRNKQLTVTLPNVCGVPELWHPETGEIHQLLNFVPQDEGITIYLPLEPLESVCLRINSKAKPTIHLSSKAGKILGATRNQDGISCKVEVPQEGCRLKVIGTSQAAVTAFELGEAVEVAITTDSDGINLLIPERSMPGEVSCDATWELTAGKQRCKVTTDKGWEEQGLATYSGKATYYQELVVLEDVVNEHLYLEVDQVCHTLEAVINGENCGTRLWRPYRLDVTGKLRAGTNNLELLVTNTAGNQMYDNTHYEVEGKAPSGMIGKVSIRPYRLVEIRIAE